MESFSNLPTAADYADANAREARGIAESAKAKADKNIQDLADIKRGIAAIGLGLYGQEKFRELLLEARKLGY